MGCFWLFFGDLVYEGPNLLVGLGFTMKFIRIHPIFPTLF